jgi:hypothetical protein
MLKNSESSSKASIAPGIGGKSRKNHSKFLKI